MRTSKPISTISYNSIDFLTFRLNDLLQRHIISYWMFIKHTHESDEKKDHIHLFVQPNRLIDSMELGQQFLEIVADNDKPLKCIDWHTSKTDDWILYNQHFEPYLLSKCETREFHYSRDDFYFSDFDTFDYYYEHAFKGSDFAKNNQILEKLKDDSFSPTDLILTGMVSWTQSSQINALAHMKKTYGTCYRNGRNNHE